MVLQQTVAPHNPHSLLSARLAVVLQAGAKAEIGAIGAVETQFTVARLVKQPNGTTGNLLTAAVADAFREAEVEGAEAKVAREAAGRASRLHPHV